MAEKRGRCHADAEQPVKSLPIIAGVAVVALVCWLTYSFLQPAGKTPSTNAPPSAGKAGSHYQLRIRVIEESSGRPYPRAHVTLTPLPKRNRVRLAYAADLLEASGGTTNYESLFADLLQAHRSADGSFLTDEKGEQLLDVPRWLAFEVRATRNPTGEVPVTAIALPLEEGDEETLEVVLTPQFTLFGFVRDQDMAGIPGLDVVISPVRANQADRNREALGGHRACHRSSG